MPSARIRRPLQTVQSQRLDALAQGHEGLAGLMKRASQAQQMLDCVRPLLPAALAAVLRSGRWNGEHWILIAPNGAAASKLQQLRPAIESELRQKGWEISRVQVQVQVGTSADPR